MAYIECPELSSVFGCDVVAHATQATNMFAWEFGPLPRVRGEDEAVLPKQIIGRTGS